MLVRISNVSVSLDAMLKGACERLITEISQASGLPESELQNFRIVRKSIDARKRSNVHFVLTVVADVPRGDISAIPGRRKAKRGVEVLPYKEKPALSIPIVSALSEDDRRPVIVGSGPAGLFCALYMARAGMKPLLVERGRPVEERLDDIHHFFTSGELNPNSNIQFGEGGAGTFSDGKLTTGTKSAFHRFILEEFVNAGAPEDILVDAKPHIGTDYLKVCIPNIRKAVIDAGGEVCFNTLYKGFIADDGAVKAVELEDLSTGKLYEVLTDRLILAIGHSARDVFESLKRSGVPMERKPFACGVRIEHPQSLIDRAQYGRFSGHPALPPADYKLAVKTHDGRGVYTFCMCPGGEVVAAASEKDGVCVNGMSNHARSGSNANSALLVEVRPEDIPGDDVLGGIGFQRNLERDAYNLGGGGYRAPSQKVGEFMSASGADGRCSDKRAEVLPTYPLGTKEADIRACLPGFMIKALCEGLPLLNDKLDGFASPDAVMTAVEARSSSPVRILRDRETLQSVGVKGLYPAGEGAGYAGGIMSAAADGLRIAERIVQDSI